MPIAFTIEYVGTTKTFYLLRTSETFCILLTTNMFYLILSTKTFYLFLTTKMFYSLLTTKTFYFSKTTAATNVRTHSQKSKPVSQPATRIAVRTQNTLSHRKPLSQPTAKCLGLGLVRPGVLLSVDPYDITQNRLLTSTDS